MQNRTDMVGVALWDRLRQFASGKRTWLMQIASALLGFVLSNSYIFGGISPFGAAFCAALPQKYLLTGAAGAVLGYTFSVNPLGNMKYIAAVLLATAAKWLFANRAPEKFRLGISAAVAFFALGIAGAAVLLSTQPTVYDTILWLAEMLLAAGATYFFSRALNTAREGRITGRSDLSCLIIALAVLLMGFAPIRIRGVSLGHILAVIAVLLCAHYGREAGGAIAGITAGIALGLSGGDYSYLITAYGLGGLVAGIFGGMGRIATAVSFVFINAVTALFLLEYFGVYSALLEIFLASVVFVALPRRVASFLGLTSLTKTKSADNATQLVLCERLEDISLALQDISETTQKVSARLGEMDKGGWSNMYAAVAEQVCRHCGLRTTCWQLKFGQTTDALNDAVKILKSNGSVSVKEMSRQFVRTCCKEEEFVSALNARFRDHVAREGVQRKVSKVRGVVTDQFDGIALMLKEISDELGGMHLLNPEKARHVSEYFEKNSFNPSHVVCWTDEFDRMSVELRIPTYQVAKLKQAKTALDLSALLEADFDLPQITQRSGSATIELSEKAAYTVEFGAYQIAAGAGRLCGDAYDFIRNKNGNAHFVLSDGMGSGGSAAVDSTMASGLITKLISVGVGHEAALKMVNSALLIKSGDESLATIDICSLDLFTGRAEFYKAGAAPTYVIKGGRAGYVESTSLPAGILRGVAFEKSGITLHEGDTVIMVSDGVTVTGTDWIKSELESVQGSDVQRICEKIATTAKSRRNDGREDDITVMAVLVRKGA